MIGWDSNNDFYMMIAVGSPELYYTFVEKANLISSALNLGLGIGIINATSTASDHLSFLRNGYTGFCFIEDMLDFNGFYHTSNNRMQFINFEYYFQNCRLIIGTLAEIAL